MLNEPTQPRIGVLAIQGNYASHSQALIEAGAEPVEVRKPSQLAGLDGLILPGGESTTMLRFLEKHLFFEVLQEFCSKKPIFGTCAGAILLARKVHHPDQPSLGLMDIDVARNAYGRQLASEVRHEATQLSPKPLEMVFIRAPIIERVGPGAQVLAVSQGKQVLVRQGHILVATFHPELTDDNTVHEYFLRLAGGDTSPNISRPEEMHRSG